jgi:hypothetical protein
VNFRQNFCPSPWLHTRINNTGNYEYCRWAQIPDRQLSPGITELSPVQWFQKNMSQTRQAMLAGEEIPGCRECHQMEKYGKISGRQRQLLKIGVTVDDFEKTMLSSPWLSTFEHSLHNQGNTSQLPQDWQIDLGNFCNSACVFCTPYSSSRIASEFKKIGLIDQMPPRAWCNDPQQLDSFIAVLKQSPSIAYLHFIGGETLITPAFGTIMQELVQANIASKTSIGFTTNLTCWNQQLIDLMKQFHQVNLGMSVECLHPLNDYVRYGSKIQQVKTTMDQWIKLAHQQNWLIQLRITPTVLSIWHLDTIYKFAFDHGIAVESCNFLHEPEFMRPSVLPADWRNKVIHKLQSWIDSCHAAELSTVINTRNPNFAHQQVIEDATSYVNYLQHQPDESYRLPDLVKYLQTLDQSRKNNLLDYLPEYEQLLRPVGY